MPKLYIALGAAFLVAAMLGLLWGHDPSAAAPVRDLRSVLSMYAMAGAYGLLFWGILCWRAPAAFANWQAQPPAVRSAVRALLITFALPVAVAVPLIPALFLPACTAVAANVPTEPWLTIGFFAWLLVLHALTIWCLARSVHPPDPDRPRCPSCGYSLKGNVSGRCPECGQAP
jgi:hypothetical protein